MDGALAIIALFFVIGIVFGAVIVLAVSIRRRDVGPPDGPDDPPGYGPPGPGGPYPDLDWDDWQGDEPGEAQENPRGQSYGR
jgi:hypothetical protein